MTGKQGLRLHVHMIHNVSKIKFKDVKDVLNVLTHWRRSSARVRGESRGRHRFQGVMWEKPQPRGVQEQKLFTPQL